MTQRDRDAIYRLDQLMETLSNPRDAYLVRSRLDRALLVVTATAGAPLPAEVGTQIGRIEEAFRTVRRRSEPFGDAWIRLLDEAREEVSILRTYLVQRSSMPHGEP